MFPLLQRYLQLCCCCHWFRCLAKPVEQMPACDQGCSLTLCRTCMISGLFLFVHYYPLLFYILSIFVLHCSQSLLQPCSCSFSEMSWKTTLLRTAPSSSSCTFVSPQMAIRALTSSSDHGVPRLLTDALVVAEVILTLSSPLTATTRTHF